MDGKPSEATADIEPFIKKLQAAFPEVPVEMEDERFTSVLAHRAMIDGGMKASERRDKSSVDRISAAIILQSWMDRTSGASFSVDAASVPETMSSAHGRSGRRRKH